MTLSAAASEVKQWRAEDATDAFWTLDPLTPVSPSDLWYTDLEGHFPDHSYDFVAPLVRRLTPPPQSPQFQHVGVVGHRGVGKTTSVRKAMGSLETRHGFRYRCWSGLEVGISSAALPLRPQL